MNEEPFQPSYTPREEFPADKLIGGVAIAIDAIGLLLGCARMMSSTNPEVQKAQREGVYGAAVLLVLVLSLAGIWIHYGIYNGRRWAFTVTLILSSCGLLGSFAKDVGALAVVTNIGLLIYSALRLSKAFGPDPH